MAEKNASIKEMFLLIMLFDKRFMYALPQLYGFILFIVPLYRKSKEKFYHRTSLQIIYIKCCIKEDRI